MNSPNLLRSHLQTFQLGKYKALFLFDHKVRLHDLHQKGRFLTAYINIQTSETLWDAYIT